MRSYVLQLPKSSVKGSVAAIAPLRQVGLCQKPGRCALRTSKEFQCLTIHVFGASPESVGKTGSAMLNLPGWGPKDGPHKRLETLSDMAQSRPQWRSSLTVLYLRTNLSAPLQSAATYPKSSVNETVAATTTVRQVRGSYS
ncbi:hypothetical protein T265_03849 [Opisthorchis viverrini]|uniref:Uncharacterized protein n=1 Tax=Opisthorchis viverrini TaxID=6198 RepID=A0A074ZR01_OPIVI|nr:hypothetical protein T265_03849 [Opisthorchis viverrini]KER29551.1 hypothetical protein T265_03849 [Opisthorchis viverrini]